MLKSYDPKVSIPKICFSLISGLKNPSRVQTDFVLNNNEKFILRRKMQCRGMSSFPAAGDNPKLPPSHRHCYQYLNGGQLRLSDLHNDDSRCRTWMYICSFSHSVNVQRRSLFHLMLHCCYRTLGGAECELFCQLWRGAVTLVQCSSGTHQIWLIWCLILMIIM